MSTIETTLPVVENMSMTDGGKKKKAVVKTGVKKPMGMKKTKGPIVPAGSHPPYSEMICKAIESLKDKNGSSRQAIAKYIKTHYAVGSEIKKINSHIKIALKKITNEGKIKQSKGTGAAGSFKIGEKTTKVAVIKPKKPTGMKKIKPAKTAKVGGTSTTAMKRMKKVKASGTPKKPKMKVAKPGVPKVAKPKMAGAGSLKKKTKTVAIKPKVTKVAPTIATGKGMPLTPKKVVTKKPMAKGKKMMKVPTVA